ncbi:MAG: DUF1732 domain-containing protein, partial [Burkholderiaceae bacterium]|nr:DUF1732 domain-containing protein [Burkholderiaceae bacterium]
MTGYGSASHPITIGQGSFANLQVEIRAVNSRFLDLSFRIPDECKSAEGALRELLNKHLKRGKVEVRAAWRQSSSEHGHSQSAIAIDLAKLRALKDAQNAIREQFPSAEELRIADILRYPGVVADSDTAEDQWHGAILKAGEEALQQLLQSRQAEGQALAKVLTNALDAMQGMVTKLEPRIPEIVTLYQNKLVARIEEALGVHATQANIPFNTELLERIRQEVVLYAVRIDVAEELARLKTHIQVARTAIAEAESET